MCRSFDLFKETVVGLCQKLLTKSRRAKVGTVTYRPHSVESIAISAENAAFFFHLFFTF